MKGLERFSKNEKYFDFEKMDKKNVQNGKAKILLTDRFFQKRVYTFMVLNVIIIKIFVIENFSYFFAEKYLGIFLLSL